MVDKQIIINGVDVSECIYYKATDKYNTCGYYCEQNPNCSYKNWKRKEQECEFSNLRIIQLQETLSQYETELDQVKEELAISIQENEEGREINAELKSKNEQLKKEIRLYDCIDKWGTEQCRCACRCLGNEFCDDADKKINKLKQALTEIKQLLEDALDTDKTSAEQSFDNFYKAIKLCEVIDD